jgi:hypothetical protein
MISKPGKGYGLAKPSQNTDIRMINSGSLIDNKSAKGQ